MKCGRKNILRRKRRRKFVCERTSLRTRASVAVLVCNFVSSNRRLPAACCLLLSACRTFPFRPSPLYCRHALFQRFCSRRLDCFESEQPSAGREVSDAHRGIVWTLQTICWRNVLTDDGRLRSGTSFACTF